MFWSRMNYYNGLLAILPHPLEYLGPRLPQTVFVKQRCANADIESYLMTVGVTALCTAGNSDKDRSEACKH
jgi:hypothetical protein